MGLGNGNPKQGDRGSNFNFEHRLLLALGNLISTIAPPPGGLATEATLNTLLNNLVASQDIEILLVRDTGNADQVVQQIREYDQGTGVWNTRYEDVNGAAYVPVGPLVYLDPSAVLNLILSELQTLNAGGQLATEVTLASILTDTTSIAGTDFATETTLANLLTAFGTEDFATEATLAALSAAFAAEDFASEATLALLEAKDFATETTLAALAATDFATETTLAALAATDFATETTLSNIETLLTGVARTGVATVDVVNGSSTAGIKAVSFWFRGNNGTLAGAAMPNGARITYRAEGNDTLNAIAFTVPTTGPSQIIRTELA